MDETTEELRQQRDALQQKANELKEQRNTLHTQSKNLAEERDAINTTIRKVRNDIAEHKKKRDELNERVKHAKLQRDVLNEKCQETKKQIRTIERKRSSTTGTNLAELRRQLNTLETEQMTKPMSPQKERKLIETISEFHAKIKKEEELLNQDPKLKKALEEERDYKQQAEKQHINVEELAFRAQQEHEDMITLINKLDNLVKRVNEVQESIINTKIKADDIHREFITHVDKIHDLERKLASSIDGQFKRKKKSEESSILHKEANEIFERFKRGEKLSTEDLMALQKAGLL